MAGQPPGAPPAAGNSLLGWLSATISQLYPSLLPRHRINHQAPRVRATVAEAEHDFSLLAQLPAAARRASFINRSQIDSQGSEAAGSRARELRQTEVVAAPGEGAGETSYTTELQGRAAAPMPRPAYGSTDTAFRDAANDSAFCSLLQLGDLQRRLEHKMARCTECVGRAGVLCTCRHLHGELLCFNHDSSRHRVTPCARTRHALLLPQQNPTAGQVRPILIELHSNDWIFVPPGVDASDGVVRDVAWIRRRGESGW